jgi:hypothetical protein
MTTFKTWMLTSVAALALVVPLAGWAGQTVRAAEAPGQAAGVSITYRLYAQEPMSLQWFLVGTYHAPDAVLKAQADWESAGYETYVDVEE